MSVFRRLRRSCGVAAIAVCVLPTVAQAYHASCEAGRLVRQDQCVASGDFRTETEANAAAFYMCRPTNGQADMVQYDYNVVWGNRYRYLCTHYHSCAEVQSVDPLSYDRFCQ